MILLVALTGAGAIAGATLPPNAMDSFARRLIRSTRGSLSVVVDLTISPDGKMEDCQAVEVAGPDDAAKDVCEAYGRTKFAAASGPDGSPVFGKLRLGFTVGGSPHRPQALEPDVVFKVPSLPEGERSLEFSTDVLFDEEGQPVACEVSERQDVPQGFGDAACRELMAITSQPLSIQPLGQVPFVLITRVRFIAESVS